MKNEVSCTVNDKKFRISQYNKDYWIEIEETQNYSILVKRNIRLSTEEYKILKQLQELFE